MLWGKEFLGISYLYIRISGWNPCLRQIFAQKAEILGWAQAWEALGLKGESRCGSIDPSVELVGQNRALWI